MKKYLYLLIPALVLTIALPLTVRAEDSNDSTETEIETETEVEVETEDSRSGLPVVREQIRIKTNNIQKNEDSRNKLLAPRTSSTTKIDSRMMASSSLRTERTDIHDDRREDVRDDRAIGNTFMKNASSSAERREIRKDMARDVFDIRKQALIKQLNVSLNNLKQIRDRISSRIDKAVENGKNMTDAKNLLVIADAKITAANAAISEITSFVPSPISVATTTSATSTATTTIDLAKPRAMGEKAITAIKAAHKALVDVVVAIARNLGIDKTATSTPPVTPPVTATSTATTTNSTATSTASTTTTI